MNDLFFIHFIITTLAVSVIMLLLLALKKSLKKHITIRWQYNLGLLHFLLLVIPLIPARLLSFITFGSGMFDGMCLGQPAAAGADAITQGGTQAVNGFNWLQDFTTSVNQVPSGFIAPLLTIIWITGIAVFGIATFVSNRRLKLVRESMKPIEDRQLAALFARCKVELGLEKNVELGTSILIKSPMTIGFFKNYIILPAQILETSSLVELRYVLLHELTHCKNGDIQVNNVMCLFQIVYWFHPLVYLAFKENRLDRELACDSAVLKRLPEDQHLDYGRTLIKFVDQLRRMEILSLATDMGGSRRQINKRIEGIASFVTEPLLLKIKSVSIFTLALVLIFSQIAVTSALASSGESDYQFQADNVVYEDLASYFDGFEGSFVLYDLDGNLYTIFDKEKSETRVSPDSTYKIYSALIALETGVISADDSIQEWDGTSYPYEAWNQEQDLGSALQNSVNWYFHNIDAQAGIQKLDAYFTQLAYGNHDLSGGIADYWMESSLLISPVEQVDLLRDFYLNETIFSEEHVDALKELLRLSEQDGAVLSGKTGTGSVNGKVTNGWFIGYVESNGHTSIFAVNIQGEDHAGGSAAAQIALSILKDKGLY